MVTLTWSGFDGAEAFREDVADPVSHIAALAKKGHPLTVSSVGGKDWGSFVEANTPALTRAFKGCDVKCALQQQVTGAIEATKGRFKTGLSRTGALGGVGVSGFSEACKHSHSSSIGNVAAENMRKAAELRGEDGPALITSKFWTRQGDIAPAVLASLTEKFTPSLFGAMHNETLVEVWNHVVESNMKGKAAGIIGVYGPQLLEAGLTVGQIRGQLNSLHSELPGKADRLMRLVTEACPEDTKDFDHLETSLATWRKQGAGRLDYLWNGVSMTGDSKAAEPEMLSLGRKAEKEDTAPETSGPGINVGVLASDLGATANRMHRQKRASISRDQGSFQL